MILMVEIIDPKRSIDTMGRARSRGVSDERRLENMDKVANHYKFPWGRIELG